MSPPKLSDELLEIIAMNCGNKTTTYLRAEHTGECKAQIRVYKGGGGGEWEVHTFDAFAGRTARLLISRGMQIEYPTRG